MAGAVRRIALAGMAGDGDRLASPGVEVVAVTPDDLAWLMTGEGDLDGLLIGELWPGAVLVAALRDIPFAIVAPGGASPLPEAVMRSVLAAADVMVAPDEPIDDIRAAIGAILDRPEARAAQRADLLRTLAGRMVMHDGIAWLMAPWTRPRSTEVAA